MFENVWEAFKAWVDRNSKQDERVSDWAIFRSGWNAALRQQVDPPKCPEHECTMTHSVSSVTGGIWTCPARFCHETIPIEAPVPEQAVTRPLMTYNEINVSPEQRKLTPPRNSVLITLLEWATKELHRNQLTHKGVWENCDVVVCQDSRAQIGAFRQGSVLSPAEIDRLKRLKPQPLAEPALYVVFNRLPSGDAQAEFIELEDGNGYGVGPEVGVNWITDDGKTVRLGPFASRRAYEKVLRLLKQEHQRAIGRNPLTSHPIDCKVCKLTKDV